MKFPIDEIGLDKRTRSEADGLPWVSLTAGLDDGGVKGQISEQTSPDFQCVVSTNYEVTHASRVEGKTSFKIGLCDGTPSERHTCTRSKEEFF